MMKTTLIGRRKGFQINVMQGTCNAKHMPGTCYSIVQYVEVNGNFTSFFECKTAHFTSTHENNGSYGTIVFFS